MNAKNERTASRGDTPGATVPDAPLVEKYLLEGRLDAGESRLRARLKSHPDDDQSRFGLGALQFLDAVEQLAQDFWEYGARDISKGMFNFSKPLPEAINPESKALTYGKFREIVNTFSKNLSQAEATLASITSADVKLPLHFGMIKLDLNGDGKADKKETLWKVYSGLNRNQEVSAQQAEKFFITFDRGDVHWLRGYCHLLMAVCDIYLAHNTRETFDCAAHLFFANVESPYKFLNQSKYDHNVRAIDVDLLYIFDIAGLIHSVRWNVIEPERMEDALHHLEVTLAESKVSWSFIMAETDDDREWIPNPGQTGVIPDVRVTGEMVTAWAELVDQSEKILSGKLLIPFWRGDGTYGINLRRVFLEPRTLDLVLWVQGPAAAPYLEKGEKASPKLWRELRRPFGRNFPGFALWFN